MQDDKHIKKILDTSSPVLSEEAQNQLWNKIEAGLPAAAPIPSPYLMNVIFRKTMTPIAILLALILGGGATAYASDAAKPGDLLFPLDRTIEDLRLDLTFSDAARADLVNKFTEERLSELREIIDEEVSISPDNASDSNVVNASTTIDQLEIDAEVFVDTTVIKLKLADQEFYFETTATTREDILAEVMVKFPVLRYEQIDQTLEFMIKDRASREKDRGVISLSDSGRVRIDKAVESLISFLDKTTPSDDTSRDNVLAALTREVAGVTEPAEVTRKNDQVRIGDDTSRVDIRIDDDGGSQIEIREGDKHMKIEEKNGEIKVEADDTSVKATKEDPENNEIALPDGFDINATVFNDITVVTIKLDNDEFYFETSATDRNGIIDAALEQFPALTVEQIEAKLSITIKYRDSRFEDSNLPSEVITSLATTSPDVLTNTPVYSYEESNYSEYKKEDNNNGYKTDYNTEADEVKNKESEDTQIEKQEKKYAEKYRQEDHNKKEDKHESDDYENYGEEDD